MYIGTSTEDSQQARKVLSMSKHNFFSQVISFLEAGFLFLPGQAESRVPGEFVSKGSALIQCSILLWKALIYLLCLFFGLNYLQSYFYSLGEELKVYLVLYLLYFMYNLQVPLLDFPSL